MPNCQAKIGKIPAPLAKNDWWTKDLSCKGTKDLETTILYTSDTD